MELDTRPSMASALPWSASPAHLVLPAAEIHVFSFVRWPENPVKSFRAGKNKYLVRLFVGRDARGKRRYHNHTVHGTKKDAQRYLTKVLRDQDLGQFVEPSDQPLEEFLDDWVHTAVDARVTTKTASDYSTLIRNHLKPALGDRKLSQLTAAEIQRHYNGLLEKGLSARTVRYVHSVLHSALDRALVG